MLTKLRTLASLYRELGFRWSAFRVAYAFRLRTGLIRLQMPQYEWSDRPLETWLKKPEQPVNHVGARSSRPIPRPNELAPNLPWNKQTAIAEADRILNGEIKYFAHEFHQVGFPPNWHQIPATLPPPSSASEVSTGHTAEDGGLSMHPTKHWSQISGDDVIASLREAIPGYEETASAHLPDLLSKSRAVPGKTKSTSQRHCDIKFIWEPNRFSFVYTLVRAHAATQDEKYAEAFWQSIVDWAEHNPPNTGANWMDGQEIALRLMAWTFGYYQFSNSPSSTPQRIAQLTQFVAAQAERIYKNIDYAISTRSNHTISEAFGLWLVGMLFPELKDSEKYLSLGRKLLEQEATAQIFPDGSYSMYSLNYHRFVLHIYLYAIRLGELNNSPFSNSLYSSISASIDYLSQLIDPQTGQMPVYGSNDGALILPLNNCDFTDYRPLLQLGSYITQKEFLFEPGAWDEDVFWLCGFEDGQAEISTAKSAKRSKENLNLSVLNVVSGSNNDGGTYILRGANSKAVIRCTDFRARPSHADQLHVDLWLGSQNVACDAGTYLYSEEGRRWRNGLAHTSAHNTVIVDSKDQMTMVSRFTWTNWAKGKVLRNDERIWQGEHNGYVRLSDPVNHRRTVLSLSEDRWLVVDHLTATQLHHYALHWLLNDLLFEQKANSVLLSLRRMKYKVEVGMAEGRGKFSIVRADPQSSRGWRSRYYGHKEPAISAMLETNQPQACFWSFFGFESDIVEMEGRFLKVNSQTIPLVE